MLIDRFNAKYCIGQRVICLKDMLAYDIVGIYKTDRGLIYVLSLVTDGYRAIKRVRERVLLRRYALVQARVTKDECEDTQ